MSPEILHFCDRLILSTFTILLFSIQLFGYWQKFQRLFFRKYYKIYPSEAKAEAKTPVNTSTQGFTVIQYQLLLQQFSTESVVMDYTFFIDNSIFYLSLELLTNFWKKNLKQLLSFIVDFCSVSKNQLFNFWPKSQAEG